ncbi:Ubiquitin carboxyl-terminal hydrolase isozyme L3, partial [Dimargaris cristalligena]|uniref:Ubiquitin carboxyl-terminal hydrolase n=1 Tax=Dimargaris cristalligena TaxID=215637 RepID=A0A4V1J4Y7_9FUNG|eukprot:RKP37199.1 hypothetical protein BJ085DRAFT_31677 [Dimargaris cristalligena]
MSDSAATTTSRGSDGRVYWVPLESNPEVMNHLLRRFGVSEAWAFNDVYGLDPDLLALVPQPVMAVILLFPITPAYDAQYLKDGNATTMPPATAELLSDVYFMKQTIGNACGTMAILHALANLQSEVALDEDSSPLATFLQQTADMNPLDRARALEHAHDLAQCHRAVASSGQTEAPAADASIDMHFVCLVEHRGHLVELDGRKAGPVDHGRCDELLVGAAEVARKLMALDPDNVRFNLVALGPSEG